MSLGTARYGTMHALQHATSTLQARYALLHAQEKHLQDACISAADLQLHPISSLKMRQVRPRGFALQYPAAALMWMCILCLGTEVDRRRMRGSLRRMLCRGGRVGICDESG